MSVVYICDRRERREREREEFLSVGDCGLWIFTVSLRECMK